MVFLHKKPMIVLAFAIIGVFVGTRTAINRGGNYKDRLQYAAVWAIALSLFGLYVTLAIGWLLVPKEA
ncbi:MAG: hypothetical protein OXE84_03585 [Rhodobacteraceae bacterium]|nr:hypothetical protein [Paracoccaceae bacterium]